MRSEAGSGYRSFGLSDVEAFTALRSSHEIALRELNGFALPGTVSGLTWMCRFSRPGRPQVVEEHRADPDAGRRSAPGSVPGGARFLGDQSTAVAIGRWTATQWFFDWKSHLPAARDSRRARQPEHGSGWESEFPRDVWELRRLGIEGTRARLRFDRITQLWLREPAKRFVRWRLSIGPQHQPGRHRHPGPQPLLRLPGQSPPRRRHARPRGPDRAGALPRRPGPGSALDPFPQPGHRLAERVLPRRAPPRLGSQPPGERDLLPGRLPPTRQAAAPGAGRPRDGPSRTARQPRPLAQPRRLCADLDFYALWAAGRRCLQLGLRLHHPGR